MDEDAVRIAVFQWLKEKAELNGGVFDRKELASGFQFRDRVYSLVGPQGIWFPAGFSVPISITTVHNGPYDDGLLEDGFLKYDYRRDGPKHRDNIGLREAHARRVPLVYFQGLKPSRYLAIWPVFILEDHQTEGYVRVAIDPAFVQLGPGIDLFAEATDSGSMMGVRRYITAITKQRLHQTAFRENVLAAYERQCAMCRLQHPELLDAAHIIADNQEGGDPVVQNGLSLCKIHNAAYDRDIIGVTPDYQIHVRADILEEVDGPMLKYGLQSLDRQPLILPKQRVNYPDPKRLEVRYSRFAS